MTTFTFTGKIHSEQPLSTASKDLIDRERRGNTDPVPIPTTVTGRGRVMYFPATGLRGKLRRSAVEVVRDAMIERTGNKTPFSLSEHYLLTLGGIKGKEKEEKVTVLDESEWTAKNPLLALFGAGAAGFLGFMRGKLSVGNAYCEPGVEPTIFSGARTDEFTRNRAAGAHLSKDDLSDLVSRAEGNRKRSQVEAEAKGVESELKKAKKAGDDDKVELLSIRLEALRKQVENIKDESGAEDNSVGMPLAGFKAIPMGHDMQHRMTLALSNNIELGLVLAALNRFGKNPVIGAKSAVGCGLVSGEWEVREVKDRGTVSLGKIVMTPFEGIEVVGEGLEAAWNEWEAFVKHGDVDFRIPARTGKAVEEAVGEEV